MAAGEGRWRRKPTAPKVLRAARPSQRRPGGLYDILGVDPTADLATITKAYRAKARMHHPDRHAGASVQKRGAQTKAMQAVNEAYGILSDAASRAQYDDLHQLGAAGEGFSGSSTERVRIHRLRQSRRDKKRRVRLLPVKWPALSPDLSPVEQVWQWVDYAVKRRGPWGAEELAKFVTEEFEKIPQEKIDRLVDSFAKRCKKVIKSRGETIKP